MSSIGLALALIATSGEGSAAQRQKALTAPADSWSSEATTLRDILSRATLDEPQSQSRSLAHKVTGLGPGVVPRLVQLGLSREWPDSGTGLEQDVALRPCEIAIVTTSLELLCEPFLLRYLDQELKADTDERHAQRTLVLLGEVMTSRELTALHDLAVKLDTSRRRIRDGFEQALRTCLKHDEQGFLALHDLWDHLDPALVKPVLRSVGATERRAGLDFLLELLNRRRGEVRPVVEALATLTTRLTLPRTTVPLDALRVELNASDSSMVVLASQCLAHLGDWYSVPRLIDLIDPMSGADRQCREAVAHSLKQMSGLDYGLQVERWRQVLEREDRWWAEEQPGLQARLRSGDARDIGKVVQLYVEHEFNRDELAGDLRIVLEHPSETVRSLGCRAMAQLGLTTGLRGCVDLLEDESPHVRAAAHESLLRSTRLTLPPSVEHWRQRLGFESSL